MAGEERDARLILQAEDRASRTFAQVAKAIKDVRKELDDQVAAAARGEGSIDAINASLTRLKDLGQELVRGQGLLKSFETIAARVETTASRLADAKTKLEAYKTELGATGATTTQQADKMARLETAVTRTQGAYDRAAQKLDLVSTRMQRAGLVAGQFDAQTDAIAAAAREAAQGLGVAGKAVDDYASNLSRAQAEQRKMNDAQALQQAVAASPLGPQDIAYVLSFDNAMEKLRETEALYAREQAVVAAAARQASEARKIGVQEALAGNEALEASFATLARQQQEAAALSTFRRVGTDAAAAAADVSRFGVAADSTGATVNRLAESVRNVLQPVQAAASTMSGAVELVDGALATAGTRGTAKINEVSVAVGNLAEAQRGLIQQAGLIDDFRQQEIVSNQVTAAFQKQQAAVTTLAQRVAAAKAPDEALTRDLHAQEQQLERLGTEMQKETTKLHQLGAALDKAGIDVHQLDVAERTLIETTRRAAQAQDQLKAKQSGQGGFLGLNPYELQNLSYQVNDVFTQLASGARPTQVLAQQGGQILQLFRGAIPMLLRFFPIIAAVVAALVTLGSAVSRMAGQAQSLRDFTAIFASMAEGARYSAQQFVEAEQRLKDLGATSEQARQILQEFIRDGLNPQNLQGFIQTAHDLAELTGKDLPDAAHLMADAFSQGMDAVNALNDATQQFHPTQLQHIQDLFDAGRADEARTEAMRITQQQTQTGIEQLEGPWTQAAHHAAEGWHNFLSFLANTGPFVAAGNALDWLGQKLNNAAIGFNYLVLRMRGLSHEAAGMEAVHGAPTRTGPAAPPDPNRRTAGGQAFLRTQQRQLSNARLLTREQRLLVAEQDAGNAAASAGASNAEVTLARTNARRVELAKITREEDAAGRSAASRARGAASRARAEAHRAEALRDRVRDMTQQVDNQIAGMDAAIARGQSRTLEQRLSAVTSQYQRVFAAIDRAEQEGVGHGVAEAQRERVRNNIVLLQQQEQQAFWEERLRDLAADRTRQLEAVENQYARGEITAADAVTRAKAINDELAPGVRAAAQQAIAFAQAIAGANPSPELNAFISRMQTFLADNTGAAANTIVRSFTESRLRDEAQRLNNVIEQRNQLVEAETSLVDLNIHTRAQGQQNIEAGYARTQPLLDAQLASMQALLQTLDLTNPALRILYDTWQARLEAIRAQSTYVSQTFTQLKQGIDGAITQNALAGFDAIAKSLGALVTGGKSVISTFADIGLAALDFVASTIGAIGRLILQMIILDAIQKATGIPVAALAGAMNGQGSFNPASFFSGILGKLFHSGGTVGGSSYGRMVPAAAFANAPRYHGGGIAGFKPNEVAAVLKKNEEVLTENDPRHRDNVGKGPAGRGLKQVLVMDPREIAGAMQSPEGEEVFLTYVRRNRTTLKQVLA